MGDKKPAEGFIGQIEDSLDREENRRVGFGSKRFEGFAMKTKLTNNTGTTISVHMNNSGIPLKVKEVVTGGSHNILIDPHATYREFWCAQLPGTNSVNKAILTSDNCVEWREVSIIKVGTGFDWRGTKRRKGNREVQAEPTPAAAGASASGSPPPSASSTPAPVLASAPAASSSKCAIM